MKHTLSATCLLVFSSLSLLGQAAPGESRIRVVHAVPDAPPVDVYVNGDLAIEALPFKSATGYIAVPPGTYTIEVNVSGTDTTVIRDMPTLRGGTDYSFIAIGRVSDGLRLLSLGDDLVPRPDDTIALRVIHAAPSAPAVDVYVGAPFSPVTGATPVLTGVPFGAASFHLNVPNNVYQGRVTPAGTKSIAIETEPLRLRGGAVRTLVAVDAEDGGAPFEIITLVDRD